MATIINNPQPANTSESPTGIIIMVVFLFVLVYLGFMYGLPALRQIKLGTPQINIPNKIDVNVHQAK